MLDLATRCAILTFVILGYLVYRLFRPTRPNIPIIGAKQGDLFPYQQARWRNFLDFETAVNKAYQHHRHEAVHLPVLGDGGTTVLLPACETQFVLDQAESILSMQAQVHDALQIDHTTPDLGLMHPPLHHTLIMTTLTNQISTLMPDLVDETRWAFEKHWGGDEDYKEVCVYDTVRRIVGCVTNRVLVGAPLCRDEKLLRAGMAYAEDVPLASRLLRLLWRPLRPLFGPLIMLPGRLHIRKFHSVILPEIKRRLVDYDTRNAAASKALAPEPNDFLQWSLRQAKESGNPYMWQPSTLAGRLLLLNFAGIHTSSFAMTNVILDLVSSKVEYMDELREELTGVLAAHGGRCSKRALARAIKLDSTLRESARLNSFVVLGIPRRVLARDGVTTPSGVHLPAGTTVAVPSYPVLHDENVYPDADSFSPFRFAEQRSQQDVDHVKRAAMAFATTGKDFLTFGHGRNACLGRFFAASELKVMLAHMLMEYDFEMQASRPPNKWYGDVRLPPMHSRIRIRKRKVTCS